jgi:hypothetical protein
MNGTWGQRWLAAYAGVLTLVFAGTVLSGFVVKPRKLEIEQLDVQRINLVEPDGTLRMVISDKAHFPGAIIRGKEYPHSRPNAGMLFFNDEGTENGGLVFSGHKDKDGKIVDSGGSLTFDKYEQDQLVQLTGAHDSSGHFAGLIVSDRADRSIEQDFIEQKKLDAMAPADRDALVKKRVAEGYYGVNRIVVGRGDNGMAQISLRDVQGRSRLVMGVAEDGSASLKFLDADGKVLNELTPVNAH